MQCKCEQKLFYQFIANLKRWTATLLQSKQNLRNHLQRMAQVVFFLSCLAMTHFGKITFVKCSYSS